MNDKRNENKKGKFPVIGRDFKCRLQNETVMPDKLEWLEWMNLLPEERFSWVRKLAREYRLLSKGSKEHGARSISRSYKSA